MSSQSYHDLIVWKEAHQFVIDIYLATNKFPTEEKYGITSQLRRAAVSVPTNIVEGYAKRTCRDCLRYFDIARGSIKECAYLLELSKDLQYVSLDEYNKLANQRTKTDYLINRFMSSASDYP
ncbi:four helix bundle protein [Candidatus Uhrbacteria bacterium]|nr:four helix bundle protein [Candidatus Uhrbacteria bacterium]